MGDVRPGQHPAVPLLLAAATTVLLFYSGIFAFLFAVPLQVLFFRRGRDSALLAAALAGAAIVLIHLLQVLRIENAGGDLVRVLLLDSLMPVGVIAAVMAYNTVTGYPWWLRLIGATAIALVGASPSLMILAGIGSEDGGLGEQMVGMLSMLGVGDQPQEWLETISTVVFSTIGVGLTAAVAATWWLGRGIAFRGVPETATLRTAQVDQRLVWLVIGGLLFVVAEWLAPLPGWTAIAGWNGALIGAFLFGVQGVGIVQHLIRLRGVGERSERWVLTIALAALFVPVLNVAVIVGLPLMGMSELWIDYRRG